MSTSAPPATATTITTARGLQGAVRVRGSDRSASTPAVFLHGAAGLLDDEPFLDLLAEDRAVYAPEWPGFGVEATETQLEDMLDFTLHGWDVVDALGLGRVVLIGHSMGGMIAAEMASLCPERVERLVLIDSIGLWLDAHPVPDVFAMLPFQQAEVLFADPEAGAALLTRGLDFADAEALAAFVIDNARRLGTAGKIMFPIPNRRLSNRLYRLQAPTLLVWGAQDQLVPPVYAERFRTLIGGQARVALVEGAGHMSPWERPADVAAVIRPFLA